MKALIHLEENGFPLNGAEFVLDGKIKRFNRNGNKNAWYIGFQNETKAGVPFEIIVYGDWKTGEEYTYQTLEKVSRNEKKEIDDKIKQAQQKAIEEKQTRQEESAKEALSLWDSASAKASNSPYLKNKKIDSLFGCRTTLEGMGRVLLVPCRDVSGKLWGIQSIQPNGSKYFVQGQKISGCFHAIGEIGESVVICEGFATAASIYQSTGKTTLCAFSASNLFNVTELIRKNFPQTSILIAGDDDRFTESGNAGRIKATEAAEKFAASVVFPQFKNLDSKPTDFNDLYVLEGAETVSSQISTQEPGQGMFIKCLGSDASHYYYMSSECPFVVALNASAHVALNLIRLLPLDYWEMHYATKTGVNWTRAASELMAKCQAQGFFQADSCRGVGVWQDGGRVIVNLGERIWDNGVTTSVLNFKSKHVYVLGKSIPEPVAPLSDEECQILITSVLGLRWKSKEHAIYLLGFLAIIRFCGALKWRPHLWVTGSAGLGKSTVMKDLLAPIAGALGITVLGDTSEAGIRQTIGNDAKSVIFDEIETNDDSSDRQVKKILNYVRQASFQGGGAIIKGGKTGAPTSFRSESCFAFSSIRVNLTNAADISRFTVVELSEETPQTREQWENLKNNFISQITPDYSERLFSRLLKNFNTTLKNCKLFEKIIAEKFNARFAQQYGILVAGYVSLTTEKELDRGSAETIVSLLKFSDQKYSIEEKDEEDCLNWLLDQKISVQGSAGREDRSIRSLVFTEESWGAVLELYGIRTLRETSTEVQIWISNSHAELKKFYERTRWQAGWASTLGRLPGSLRGRIRFGGGNARQAIRVTVPC